MLQNLHLRRIEWAISSPSLMDYPFCVNYIRDEKHRRSVTKLLAELDSEGASVNAHFDNLRHMPMGKYFEQLILFILDKDQRFVVLLANHQIIEDKRTIGEIDVILKDLETGQVEHWEICLKFYLQSKKSKDQLDMLGPGAKDNMDRKIRKLTSHQMKLSKHPSIKYLVGTENIESKLFMKGQLFYHLGQIEEIALDVNQGSESCSWCFQSEAKDMLNQSLKYLIINKPDWIGKLILQTDENLLSKDETLLMCEDWFSNQGEPFLFVGLAETETGWQEETRGFVVPTSWPK